MFKIFIDSFIFWDFVYDGFVLMVLFLMILFIRRGSIIFRRWSIF